MKESDLYPPVKAFLEAQGYTVKAEVGAVDVMACRDSDPPLIVELKTALNLALILQGVARQGLFDHVYLAVPQPAKWTHRYRDLTVLLRRLGLGLLTVRDGLVEPHLDPAPYQPRKNVAKAGRLLREFHKRQGDPNIGGTTGIKRVTAYRQDAMRLAAALGGMPEGTSPAALAKATGIARAAAILRANHYGWFDHPAKGRYTLSSAGQAAL
ncbi:DUF2161 family putative PD-(D/E)XK-type phosphodiesterase [Pseudotabrizicola sp.]|uniref:DUF2161 family putative PD-(D/E)XK-type phosphodiesterase n=1 Tax=Pseudotabrizicola sp. TaxID=2939647 RepID=UPI00271A1DF6|nr:DUF2161 family putative PD-(D/E)XK-type phosphodiesterase [Pseudotabrizicola sp.]MDO8884996.1 DUF2161 family putative PD-(D/E)XK-type phosphodiesterase [Pseudotabrizicola sp.]